MSLDASFGEPVGSIVQAEATSEADALVRQHAEMGQDQKALLESSVALSVVAQIETPPTDPAPVNDLRKKMGDAVRRAA